jgi:predicted PurR-regulated permease PerM
MKINQQISPTLRFFLGFASISIVLVFMNLTAEFLNSVILAFIIVVTVTPILYGLQRRRVPGWLAYIITLALIIALFIILILLLVGSLSRFAAALPTYASEVENFKIAFKDFLTSLGFDELAWDLEAMVSLFDLSALLELGVDFLSGLMGTLSNFILIFLIIIFLLIDALGLPTKTTSLLETNPETINRLTQFTREVRQYVGITTIVGLATGILDTIFFLLVGVDFAVLWGILAFLMSYIPTIGFWIALIPPVILAFFEFGLPTAVLVFVGIVLINGFAENVVKPKYLGEGLNLSIFVVVFSVFFWAAVLGPVGAILAVPLTMAIKNLVLEADESNRWVAELMSSAKKQPTQAKDDLEQADKAED